MKRIEADTTILEVHAMTAPVGATTPTGEEGKLVKIADIILRTPLLTSKWGDANLFFRHRPVHKDRRYWPRDWVRNHSDVAFKKTEENIWGFEVPQGVWPETDDEAEAFYIEQVKETGCPFAWLLQQ